MLSAVARGSLAGGAQGLPKQVKSFMKSIEICWKRLTANEPSLNSHPGFSMLILLAERLGIGFAVWIKEFFAPSFHAP